MALAEKDKAATHMSTHQTQARRGTGPVSGRGGTSLLLPSLPAAFRPIFVPSSPVFLAWPVTAVLAEDVSARRLPFSCRSLTRWHASPWLLPHIHAGCRLIGTHHRSSDLAEGSSIRRHLLSARRLPFDILPQHHTQQLRLDSFHSFQVLRTPSVHSLRTNKHVLCEPARYLFQTFPPPPK